MEIVATSHSMKKAAWSQLPVVIVALLILTAYIIGMYAIGRFMPASHWIDVREIHIYDAKVGHSPLMTVQRTIKRPVFGRWIVTVFRKEEGEGYSVFCTQTGQQFYNPEARLPGNLTLDWWTWPKHCDLPIGEYFVSTTYRIQPDDYPRKTINVSSNAFTISAP